MVFAFVGDSTTTSRVPPAPRVVPFFFSAALAILLRTSHIRRGPDGPQLRSDAVSNFIEGVVIGGEVQSRASIEGFALGDSNETFKANCKWSYAYGE